MFWRSIKTGSENNDYFYPGSSAIPTIILVAQLWKIQLLVLNKSSVLGSVLLCAEHLRMAS